MPPQRGLTPGLLDRAQVQLSPDDLPQVVTQFLRRADHKITLELLAEWLTQEGTAVTQRTLQRWLAGHTEPPYSQWVRIFAFVRKPRWRLEVVFGAHGGVHRADVVVVLGDDDWEYPLYLHYLPVDFDLPTTDDQELDALTERVPAESVALIQWVRRRTGYSLRRLSETVAGISHEQLRRYEQGNGTPTYRRLHALLGVADCTIRLGRA